MEEAFMKNSSRPLCFINGLKSAFPKEGIFFPKEGKILVIY